MNTNVSEMANLPISFEIGGRTLKIVRLNIAEIFGHFEKVVKEQHMKNIKEISTIFDSTKEKMEYLKDATKTIPNKIELQRMAHEYLQTESGIAEVISIGLNKCQKLSDPELIELFQAATAVEIQLITQYLFGIDPSESATDTDSVKKNM